MKTNYTISERYTLPSQGKIYEKEFDPNITIRSMTTQEEMRRVAPSEFIHKNLCDIIDDCIVEDLPISCYDMCIGDYQYLIHKLRCVTYGKDYPVITTCRFCGNSTEETIDLEKLRIIDFDEDILKYLSIDLPVSKCHVELNVQTPRMLDRVEQNVHDYRKRMKGKVDTDPTIVYLITSLIKNIDGKKMDALKLEDWVKSLPMKDVNTILAYADKFNSSIGVDINLEYSCDNCGKSSVTAFKAGPEFFRPQVEI